MSLGSSAVVVGLVSKSTSGHSLVVYGRLTLRLLRILSARKRFRRRQLCRRERDREMCRVGGCLKYSRPSIPLIPDHK
ncbi:hypothetical protein J6590_029550 [Homalodisca vitripennis]|nr:hypothetical protein J6590_029550 [Homalodisca vitripennis]